MIRIHELQDSIHKMLKFQCLIVSSENAMYHLCTRYKNAITDDFGILVVEYNDCKPI